MKTYTIHIHEHPTGDYSLFWGTISETDTGGIRGDRLDAQGDPRLGAWFPGISDHLTFVEGLCEEPVYVQTGSNTGSMTFRSRDAEVIIFDVTTRQAEGSCDVTMREIDQIIAALIAGVTGANTRPDEAIILYIERLVDLGHVGIIHRVVNLYCQGNRSSRHNIAGHLARILSTKYRPILNAGSTNEFQLWAMEPLQIELFDRLRINVGNSLLPGIIDEVVIAFEDRPRQPIRAV